MQDYEEDYTKETFTVILSYIFTGPFFHIPHFNVNWQEDQQRFKYKLKISPHRHLVKTALVCKGANKKFFELILFY